ncbi:drug/metabolite DMT transporter permease [Vibrio vulnificus]|uniref:aromatic amino acid DMT transporter YddG n=1 Tax=Vibrio vulnificus TaxID=672 RepID=UPI000CD1A831|nr:aromatic amino acid DMT transporter YddG [Vibrio vulnificus]EHH0803051.1 drug/metabolite DMT transporter permease [Vibrio vulnificus]EJL7829382.1 aromatic amino acid DMT transporter YddG [Vibrio vulnificus]ELP5727319.1 aromatic amino acid DMT transporter YddG [Vibrio vulnificus]POC17218.1 EamA family transporter [Vibrio vulnificus]
MTTTHRYTLFGLLAILFWSCLLAMTRMVAESFGALGGAALLYTCSAIMLMMVLGIPKLRHFAPRYLLLGGALFVSYEILLALSLGYAESRMQSIQVSIVNYLWPALTVLFAAWGRANKPSPWLYPSVLLAFVGVAYTVSGDDGLSIEQMFTNIASNPTVFIMALVGAVIWAIYCNVTQRQKSKHNAITLFFIATAVTLWLKFAFSQPALLHFEWRSSLVLLGASTLMAGGYALWNVAIVGGNMMFLATLSYFTPVLSALFSSIILGVTLPGTFWQGVAMVTIGSLACWWFTRSKNAV